MRVVAISDTHNQHAKLEIPDCDLLIHAGDFTNRGTYTEVMSFLDWFGSLKQAKNKVFIAGNHDHLAQREPYVFSQLVPRNVTYLKDSEVILEGNIKVYGTPWSPFFYDWSFNGLEEKGPLGYSYEGGPGKCSPDEKHPLLSKIYAAIPTNTDILVCHSPVRTGNLDITRENKVCGSLELTKAIEKLACIRLVIGGHIHEGYGHHNHKGIDCYNVSSVSRGHDKINPPTIIDI